MIEHLVLFKLKPELDAERIEWMLRETRIQLLKIPAVKGLRCGYRIDPAVEWPFFLLIELDSEDKLAVYMSDPVHVRYVSEVIKPNITERLALDYQTDLNRDPLYT